MQTPSDDRRIVGIAPGESGALSCHAEEPDNFLRYVYVGPGTVQPPRAL